MRLLSIFKRKPKCTHEKYRENLACRGICVSCGEDLGFVGSLKQGKFAGYTGELERLMKEGKA